MMGVDNSTYSYAPKSKLLYMRQNQQSRRAKTGHKYNRHNQLKIQSKEDQNSQGNEHDEFGDTQSRLSKAVIKRFNEDYRQERQAGTKSQAGRSSYSINAQSLAKSQSRKSNFGYAASQAGKSQAGKSVFSQYQ